MFGHRYFGARYFGPRYFGDGGTGESEVLDYRRYRRKYFVRVEDRLFVFENPFDAQQFERSLAPEERKSKKAKKRALKIVRSAQYISLPAVIEAAPAGMKSEVEAMIEKAQYARLMALQEELEEEELLELILINL